MRPITKRNSPALAHIWAWLFLACTSMLAASWATAQDKAGDTTGIGRKSVLDIQPEVLKELSDEEQKWYETFNNGVLFFDGWASISQDILEIYPVEQLHQASPMVQRLGVKIGTEWCKANDVRKIDNGMLQEWGKRLRSSIALGPDTTTETLLEIEQEVDLILQHEDELSLVAPQS